MRLIRASGTPGSYMRAPYKVLRGRRRTRHVVVSWPRPLRSQLDGHDIGPFANPGWAARSVIFSVSFHAITFYFTVSDYRSWILNILNSLIFFHLTGGQDLSPLQLYTHAKWVACCSSWTSKCAKKNKATKPSSRSLCRRHNSRKHRERQGSFRCVAFAWALDEGRERISCSQRAEA